MLHRKRSEPVASPCHRQQALLCVLKDVARMYLEAVRQVGELVQTRDSLAFEEATQRARELRRRWDVLRGEYDRHCTDHHC